MARTRLAILYGGRSAEHQVSVVSARSVMEALDPDRFEVRYVSANGGIRWNRDWVNVSTVCIGEYVGLEEIDNGIWQMPDDPKLRYATALDYFARSYAKLAALLEDGQLRLEELREARARAPQRRRLGTGWRREVLADGLEELADEAVRRPVGEADLAARPAHAQHFGGGLVGKRKRQYIKRIHPFAHQVSNTGG